MNDKALSNGKDDNEEVRGKSDLTKALAFLLSKEAEDISDEKKRDFLLKKLPVEIIEEAMALYPMLKAKIKERASNNSSKGIFSSFFDLGIISSTVLVTLALNYLFDINKEKKNAFFYQSAQERLNEQFDERMDEIQDSVSNAMNNYVKADSLSSQIASHLDSYSQGKGLSVNLSNNKIKQELSTIQSELVNQKKEISALNDKISINSCLLSKSIKEECNALLKTQLNQPIDLQDDQSQKDDEGQSIIISALESIETKELKVQLLNELNTKLRAINETYNTKGELIKLNISNAGLNQFNPDVCISILTASGLSKAVDSAVTFQLDQSKTQQLKSGIKAIETILTSLTSSN